MNARLAPVWLALFLAACGEDVNFESGTDASPPAGFDASFRAVDGSVDAGLGASDGGSDAARDGGRDGRRTPDASCIPRGGVAFACRDYGLPCRSPQDCCSGRCEQNDCLPVGTCLGPGAPCTTRSNCCSGRCEPIGRMGELECAPFCRADGSWCQSSRDCCSLGCNGGICGAPICATAGSPCSADSSCCSGLCEPTGCAEPATSCLPSGEGCARDGGVRCCTFCNFTTGRCDLGRGNCLEPSSPCDRDGDCCLGHCLPDPQNPRGPSVCTAPCRPDGANCNSAGDCCGRVCTGAQPHCETPPPFCP